MNLLGSPFAKDDIKVLEEIDRNTCLYLHSIFSDDLESHLHQRLLITLRDLKENGNDMIEESIIDLEDNPHIFRATIRLRPTVQVSGRAKPQ